MEFEDDREYETVDFEQEALAEGQQSPAQPPPSVPARNQPTKLNRRSPRDALPPVPQDNSRSTGQTSQKQSVPSNAAVVQSLQTFFPHDLPPTIPKRRKRRLLDKRPPIPAPQLPEMTPPTSPAKQITISSPIRHSMAGRVTSALVDPVDKDKPMSFSRFVKRYSDSLPLRIRVDNGFCDQDEQGGISSGDVYIIHFLKHTKMVTIADMSGYTYKIPLNSAVEFALLYDPDQDFNKASRGYTFEKAGDIIALKSKLPRVVRALRAHNTNDPKSSVREKELFIVKGINRTTVTTLKVYSVTNQKEKVLSKDCMGKFTTASSYIRMYVAEILEYLPDQLPLKAAVCLNADSDDILPAGLTTDAATIQCMGINTSLIATPFWEGQDDEEEDYIPVEISINLDIDVTILEDNDDEMIYENTRKLLEDFDPSKIQLCHSNSGEDLYCAVREGHETLGTEIQKPQILLQLASQIPPRRTKLAKCSPPPLPPQTPLPPRHLPRPPLPSSKAASSVSPKHQSLPVVMPELPVQKAGGTESPPSQEPSTPPPTKPCSPPGEAASDAPPKLDLHYQNLTSNLQREVNTLSTEVQKIKSCISSLDEQVAALQEEVRELKVLKQSTKQKTPLHSNGDESDSTDGDGTLESDSTDVETMNRTSLTKMSHMEIMKLLEAMNLTHYQGVFMKEKIDGELLAECSDDILEQELKVTSKLHRAELMKVITGHYSAQNILDGEAQYVDMIK